MSAKQKKGIIKQHPTIGVIFDSMISGYQISLWRGIKEAAQTHDANLLCFLGREIDSPIGFRQRANAVYQLVNQNNVDGIIVITGTISHFLDSKGLEAYLEIFAPIPVVSIAVELTNIPSIILDNYQGVSAAITHLIEVHNYRRIGFIRMREGHAEGDLRFQAYQDTLDKFNIPYDPDLVVPGEYYDNAQGAIKLLYEERKVSPEAIFVVDDYMALPVIMALQANGHKIPEDVAVVGFDDIEEARYTTPPLTTVRQPLWEEAHQAVDMLLTCLQGDTVPLKVTLSPNLVIRDSCGCFQANILQAGAPAISGRAVAKSLEDQQKPILSHILETSEIKREQPIQELFEAFNTSLEIEQPEQLLTTLNQILQEVEKRDEDILAWQSVISALRPYVLNILQRKAKKLMVAESLIQQARVMISEAAQRSQANRRLKTQLLNVTFRNLSQALNTTTNIADLLDALTMQLPNLGIPEFYLALYEQKNPEADVFRLVLACSSNGCADLPPDGLTYSSDQLLPEEFSDQQRRFTRMVEPLYFQDDQFGFAVFEAQSYDESIYDALAEQISSGLKGNELVQQVERRAVQLQTATDVSRSANSILDPDELIPSTVNLIQERFNLYYAGLFIVDEARKWAQLRAGTGEPGQKMLAENWQLEVGGNSMIGHCVATGEPDIQLDVDQAPVHLRNPYLTKTKSELALPLFSRGQILGALTIQSENTNAFSEDDITVLQSMADQLANAIDNAYLYNALAEEQYLMTALMDNLPEPIYFKDKDSRFLRISRYMVENFGVDEPSDVIGKTDFDFFTEDHARLAFKDEQQIIKTGEALLNVEERETWEDRPDTWVLSSKLPLYDEQGSIVGTFGVSRDITERKQAQIALERQSNQLQTTIDVSRAISEILEPDRLTQQVVDLVKERFNLYYAGLFLVDELGEYAVLQAGSGEAGEKMLAENWQLEINEKSMIGRCIEIGQPDIQLDVNKAPVHLRNPHLPQTKSEMALPLFSRGVVFGALTIQSTEPDAFSPEDAQVLQTMANQVATALANARLFEQTQMALMDSETLLNVSRLASNTIEIETSLAQVLDLTLKATGIEAGLLSMVTLSGDGLEIVAQKLPQEMATNLEKNGLNGTLCDLVYRKQEAIIIYDLKQESPIDVKSLIKLGLKSYQGVPVEAKGRIYGTLCTFSESVLTSQDSRINLLQAIGQQIGIAIENAQLFEQTQEALTQTASLFAGSEKIVRSNSSQAVLNALVDSTAVKNMERAGLLLFDRPWDDDNQPSSVTMVAAWTQPNVEFQTSLGTQYPLEEYPLTSVIGLREPIFTDDIFTSERLDENSRQLMSQVFGALSAISLPLIVGNQSIGGIVALSGEKITFNENDIRQIVSLTDQAATVVQNLQLYEQTQAALAETEQQTAQLTALTQLSNQLSQTGSVDDILNTAADIIHQILPADQMSIARLTEDGRQIELLSIIDDQGLASTGRKLPLESGLVGKAITIQEAIVVSDATQNELTRDTQLSQQGLKSYLVAPLIASGRGIGALNFGRSSLNAFSERDRDLALQVALLMGNAIENQSLLQQTRETLAELEAIQRRYQIQAWSSYNQSRESGGYQQNPDGLGQIGKQLDPETKRAVERQVPIVSEDGEKLTLTIPIMLRDEPIGAVGIQAKEGKRQWSPEEIALAQDISEQFALAAESLRLLDETQRRAARERLVAEITTKLRATNDPEEMLQTAAQELRVALKAKRAQVLLKRSQNDAIPPEPSSPTETEGGES